LLCQQAGGVAKMLDGREYDIGIEQGYILSAANQTTWDAVRDCVAPVLLEQTKD